MVEFNYDAKEPLVIPPSAKAEIQEPQQEAEEANAELLSPIATATRREFTQVRPFSPSTFCICLYRLIIKIKASE